MPGEMNLKPCPFCGSGAEITDPYVGEESVRCPSCGCGTSYMRDPFASWNRRTPEPGTSAIRWTRYDGTPEMLPGYNPRLAICGDILFIRTERGFTKQPLAGELYFDDEGEACWKKGMTFWRIMPGDLWAYLPEPPEGMA